MPKQKPKRYPLGSTSEALDYCVDVLVEDLVRDLRFTVGIGADVKKVLTVLRDDGLPKKMLDKMIENATYNEKNGEIGTGIRIGQMASIMFDESTPERQLEAYSKLLKRLSELASSIDPSNRRMVRSAIESVIKDIADPGVSAKVKKFAEVNCI